MSRQIVGAFYDVYNALGFGFLESIYARALDIALKERGLRVDRELPVEVFFHGRQVEVHRLDMLVDRRVIVEIKSSHKLAEANLRQLLSYVTATNMALGILLHFGPHATFHRVLCGRKRKVNTSDSRHSRNS